MAFHKTNYGQFGVSLPSDLDGYVPEPGDRFEDFHWDGFTAWNEDTWEDFITEAKAAVAEANMGLREWRHNG